MTKRVIPLKRSAADPSMDLPPGKTCADCAHCERCCAIFGHIPQDEACDFWPSRFREKVVQQVLDTRATKAEQRRFNDEQITGFGSLT